MEHGKVRVLLADDHPVLRRGLAEVIREEQRIELVGEACDGWEAVEMAGRLCPDVIVMDVSMPRLDGVEAVRRIRAELPDCRVIGLSMYESDEMARAMREAGAAAYVNKSEAADTLIPTILAQAAP
jgi:DNA-binding NarL/FixJ family response regulator